MVGVPAGRAEGMAEILLHAADRISVFQPVRLQYRYGQGIPECDSGLCGREWHPAPGSAVPFSESSLPFVCSEAAALKEAPPLLQSSVLYAQTAGGEAQIYSLPPDAPPIPPKKLNGIDITNAHGHDTTKNDNALYSHTENVLKSFNIIGGINAKSTAIITTVGV